MTSIKQSFNQAKRIYEPFSDSKDYNRYSRDFKRFLSAKGITGEDAEDIIQDALLKLLGSRRELSPEQIQPYFARIVINTMHDHRKLAARQKHTDYETVKFHHTGDQAQQIESM